LKVHDFAPLVFYLWYLSMLENTEDWLYKRGGAPFSKKTSIMDIEIMG